MSVIVPELDRPDILFLAHRVPYPPDKGDRIRTFHVLRFLGRFARIHLACLTDEPVSEAQTTALRELCARVAIFPLGAGRWLRAALSLARGGTATAGAFESPAMA